MPRCRFHVANSAIGAHFTHTLVTRYQSIATLPPLQKPLQTSPTPSSSVPKDDNLYQPNDGSKESLNLLSLISELYNAKVISSGLIYDLVRQFLSIGLEESGVEGLLRIVKCESIHSLCYSVVMLIFRLRSATPQ